MVQREAGEVSRIIWDAVTMPITPQAAAFIKASEDHFDRMEMIKNGFADQEADGMRVSLSSWVMFYLPRPPLVSIPVGFNFSDFELDHAYFLRPNGFIEIVCN